MGEHATTYPRPWTAILETNNPLDVTPEDLEELADLLEGAVPQSSIEIGYEDQFGAGVTFHEVLIFWIPNAESVRDNLYAALIGATIPWLAKRFKRRHGERRVKSLTVYDASTGQPLRTWVLRDSESEPQEQEPDTLPRPLPTRRRRARHRRDTP